MRSLASISIVSIVLLGAGCAPASVRPEESSVPSTAGTVRGVNDERIDLRGRGLRAVPDDVLRRGDVTALDLSDNELEGALPAEIRHMRSLRTLDVSGNRMTGLPAEIGQLRNLRVLDLSGNQLTGLPYELGDLQQLETIDLTGNQVSEVDLVKIVERLPKTTVIKR